MDDDEPATEMVDAELSLWRVAGLGEVYVDRPTPYWALEEQRGPGSGDRLRVSIGDVPEDLVTVLQEWEAQRPILANLHVGNTVAVEGIDSEYLQNLQDVVPQPFRDSYPLWFAMRLSRPVQVPAYTGRAAFWLAVEPDLMAVEFERFEAEGNLFLDEALARMVGAIHPMNFGEMRYLGRSAWVTSRGRASWKQPRFKLSIRDSGVYVTRGGGWAAADVERVAATLRELPAGVKATSFGKYTAGAGELFAVTLSETDDLRRFVFAFAGLELLASKVEKGYRARLLKDLAADLPALPIAELL